MYEEFELLDTNECEIGNDFSDLIKLHPKAVSAKSLTKEKFILK